MPITHDPQTNTWGFLYGKQAYIGYASHEAAATALYDLERGAAPTTDYAEFRAALCRTLDAVLSSSTAEAFVKIPEIDRPFALIIGEWIARADERYRAMATAGAVLLEAAANGTALAEQVTEAAAEESEEERAFVITFAKGYAMGQKDGYDNGFAKGFEGCLDTIKARMKERRPA